MGRKNYIILFLTLIVTGVTVLFFAMRVGAETSVAQEEKETSGYAGVKKSKSNNPKKPNENITWTYDAATKTLTFSGSGLMMSNEGNIDEYASKYDRGTWYIWQRETEHIVIGEGIRNIGDYAFYAFRRLSDVSLPDSLQHIDSFAFVDSGLKSVTIPKGVKKIGQYAFAGANLSSITIENGVEEIWDNAFCDTQLEKIVFPKSVYFLGDGVLSECESLKKVVLPTKIKEIPGEIFYGCIRLRGVHIPKSVNVIGDSAFANSGLRSITIKNRVEEIWDYAFCNTNLEEITFPKSVYILSDGVLEGCEKLKTVKIKSKKLEIESKAFRNFPSKATIIVPKGKKNSYSKMFYKAGLSKKIKIKESKTW